jgi:phosphomannomutase
MGQIKFGTDGWRAVIAVDFNLVRVCLTGFIVARNF